MKTNCKLFYCILFLIVPFFPQKALSLEGENFNIVNSFITTFQKGDKQEIAKFISFPLSREKPIPSIDTPKDFVRRFEEIFDYRLSNMIKNSDIHKDWQAVGWRGIMLHNGDLWIDYDGKVKTINYQSDFEKALKEKLIESEKKNLYMTLRKYIRPVLDWRTKSFRVRIDEIADNKFRYVAWAKDKSPLTKPNLILNNGKWVPEGSGGNHHYEFDNGDFMYKVYVFVLGSSETPIGSLEVFNKNKQLLSEDFIEVMNP